MISGESGNMVTLDVLVFIGLLCFISGALFGFLFCGALTGEVGNASYNKMRKERDMWRDAWRGVEGPEMTSWLAKRRRRYEDPPEPEEFESD
jgi:hypothetical protein